MAIVVGYVIVSRRSCLIAIAVVWGVVLATGMPVRGGASRHSRARMWRVLLNVATTLYGAGIALRFSPRRPGR